MNTVDDWTTHKGEDVPCVKMEKRRYVASANTRALLRTFALAQQARIRGEIITPDNAPPNIRRYEEPIIHPEVQAIQERMLAKFGRHEGHKQKRTLPGSDLTKYGMEPCWSCGKITAIDMTCLDCGAERPYQLPVA